MKQKTKLYQKAKTGKIHFWQAWTENHEVIIEHGILDGRSVINRYTANATNVGKTNERTPAQQAIFEVDSLYKKKLDKKYCTSKKEAQEEKFLPMTANNTDVKSKRLKITYPCFVQRKYNGLRCMVNWRDNKIFLMSRGNKQYVVKHLEEQLTKILRKNDALDGEIYTHMLPLATINSLTKKWKPEDSRILEYHIYDYPYINGKNLPQEKRLSELQNLKTKCEGTNIIIVETLVANSWEEVVAYEKHFVAEGYEGAIVRTAEGLYNFGNRSNSLLKVKSFKDAEFEVVGYNTEISNINNNEIHAVIWICKNNMVSPDGSIKTFEVRPKGSLGDRSEQLLNAKDYIGKKLTVKYFDRTPDNIPFHGVGLHFRLKEDLANG